MWLRLPASVLARVVGGCWLLDVAHGVVPALTVGSIAWEAAPVAQEWLRTKAEEAEGAGDLLLMALYVINAGAIIGFFAGYASHLFLDMNSKSGLPLIARGC